MLKLRPQKVSDAERYFEILSSPRFVYFPVVMKSVEQEREWLRKSLKRRKKGHNASFAILHDGRVVGAIGYRRVERHAHVAEIGYFLDETYWGKGLAVKAVRMLETYLRKNTRFTRLEIQTALPNKASQRVAEKCGYTREGVLRRRLFVKGKYYDSIMFGKLLRRASRFRGNHNCAGCFQK